MSEYEAKQLQRLQENEAALAALGIEKLSNRKRSYSEKTARKAAEREAMIEVAWENSRRSSRLVSAPHFSSRGRSRTKMEVPELALTRAEQNDLFADTRSERSRLPDPKPSA